MSESSATPASDEPPSSQAPEHPNGHGASLAALALGALGVVYGDIGTSPLYAIKECFHGIHAIEVTPDNILGVLSLVFWSLTMVVSFKYLGFVVHADNRGEGGIFALLALIPGVRDRIVDRATKVAVVAALAGAALLYGDGMITPAISVLSAVEGLEVATRAASGAVVPLTCFILIGLFAAQRRGTAGIGRIFGPVMAVWFVVIATFGVLGISHEPRVLGALNPVHALSFFATHRIHGFVVLSSVVLCITGGEALYADLGHFGRKPIELSWFSFVFPALVLNYFGQGALLLHQPEAASNPFFGLVPRFLLLPTVALSTVATVIASQALITGSFSLTQQAIQLGYCPRLQIVHTSDEMRGQIYIPAVNGALAVACVALVLAFRESSRLAAAYGIAVTATMGITSVLYFVVVTRNWRWPLWKALPPVALFLAFDVTYFGSNLLKVVDGGWVPILMGSILLVAMTAWKDGRAELGKRISDGLLPLDLLLGEIHRKEIHRVRGTAVFLSSLSSGTPPSLLHHLKHNQVLHEQVVLLTIQVADVPKVERDARLELKPLGEGFFRLIAHYGFMETPNVPDIVERADKLGLRTEPMLTSYFLSRETLRPSSVGPMARWRKELFALISRNARPPSDFFGLPPGRVIELGLQIEI